MTEDTGHMRYFQNARQTVGRTLELTQHEVFKIHSEQDLMICIFFFLLSIGVFVVVTVFPLPPLYIKGTRGRHVF